MVRGSLGARGSSITSFCCSCGATWPIGQSACLDTRRRSFSRRLLLDFLEKSTVPWKPSSSSSSFFFSDRQKKSFEDRDNHFAPRNCTANYDAFYVDPIRLELWLELPSSKRFTKRTLLKSLFPWLAFFKILFMEFQIRRRRKRRNKRFQKRRHNVRHNLSFFPFDGAMENGSRRKGEN